MFTRGLSVCVGEFLWGNGCSLTFLSLDDDDDVEIPILFIDSGRSSPADHGCGSGSIFNDARIVADEDRILVHSGAEAQTLEIEFGSAHDTSLERSGSGCILQSY